MRFPRTFPAGPSCMPLFHLNIRKHENNPSDRSEGEKSMIWNRITFPREKALKHPRGVKNTPETQSYSYREMQNLLKTCREDQGIKKGGNPFPLRRGNPPINEHGTQFFADATQGQGPAPSRIAKTGGPGTQMQVMFRSTFIATLARLSQCGWKFLASSLCLMPGLHNKICSKTCPRPNLRWWNKLEGHSLT